MSGSEPDRQASRMEEDLARLDAALRARFSWYTVAKKEFQDAIRSKGLWILSAVFTLVFIFPVAGALYLNLGQSRIGQQAGMQVLIDTIYLDLVTVFLPFVTIFVGVAAITKERKSGSLKVLLSLPFSRRDVIVGKVVGRCGVVAVPFVIASGLTAVFLLASKVNFEFDVYATFMLFSLLFALVMVAIAVSISGAVSTTVRSFLANLAVYVYFSFFWNSVANEIGKFLSNEVGLSGSVRWHSVLFIKLFSPTQSYKTLVRSLLLGLSEGQGRLAAQQAARYRMFNVRGGLFSRGLSDPEKASLCSDVVHGVFQNATVRTIAGNTTQKVCQQGSGSLPIYFSDFAVILYMLAWIVVAAAVSYYTFDTVDL